MRLSTFVLLASSLAPTAASAAPPTQQWFTVLLDGRKIGAFESKRVVQDGHVTTVQSLDVELERAGVHVALGNAETSTETLDGRPLSFRSVSKLSGSETVIDGTVHDGVIDVVTGSATDPRKRSMPWPKGALLPEGIRLAGLRAGLAAGTRAKALSFQPSSLDAAEVTSVIGAGESVDLPQGRRALTPIEQTIAFPGAQMKSRAWVDDEQTVYKLTMPMLGVDLTLLACDRACATAPNQGSDVFARTLMSSPRPLRTDELSGAMRYTLKALNDGAALNLPQTDEQRVAREGDAWIVTVRKNARIYTPEKPPLEDLMPNDWLQSTAPEIVQLAARATGDAKTREERMQRIETFVRSYIRTKNLDVGYASALDVARKPEGDCTEHAVLVAALGRASGIATRVVDGLAYAPGFAGKDQVFVPHAWAQAFVEGRWQSFDAALMGFDAGHIALAIGDGDPWRFYSGLDMLGRIKLDKVETVAVAVP
ncbi:MAG: transglutaminase-like domain-containing protein [Dokdonella sp.]|uniref:transglutaminase-like domain-containing protein n=1 Tax=Dokdonella sp. TaxID=2291710 RepID=UPI003263EFBE